MRVRERWWAAYRQQLGGAIDEANRNREEELAICRLGASWYTQRESVRAGIRNANIMTLVGSAHRHDLDVHMYLEDVINHLNRGTGKPE